MVGRIDVKFKRVLGATVAITRVSHAIMKGRKLLPHKPFLYSVSHYFAWDSYFD